MKAPPRLPILLVAAFIGATVTLCTAPAAFAQSDTGVMFVRVVDPDAVALPGVQVVTAGPVGTQTQFTGVDGTARFPGLYPGDGYSITSSLDGFATVVRENLGMNAQHTTSIIIEMRLVDIEESVMVFGESPLVDVRSSIVATNYTDDLIDMAPTSTGLWSGVLDHIPGIVSTTDVGSGESAVQRGPRAWGSSFQDTTYSINGADTTYQALGGSAAYFSISSFEEVSVAIAAQDIETRSPGVAINMVVKSGSNDWNFGAKFFYEGEGLVSDNIDEELEDQGITGGTAVEGLTDFDVQGGGPLVRDRAWFFVDFWNYENRREVVGLEERDRNVLRDLTINTNVQVTDNNKLSGRYIRTLKYRNNRGASRFRPYLGWVQDSVTHIPQVQWQSVINRNVFTDVRFGFVQSDFSLARRWPPGGNEDGATPSSRSPTWDNGIRNYVVRPSLPTIEFLNDEKDTSLDGSTSWYVTGEDVSHDLKFGGNYKAANFRGPYNYANGYRSYVDSRIDPEGNAAWEPGVPVEVRLYNLATDWIFDDVWQPNNQLNIKGRSAGLFLQDTVTIRNRLTIVGGLRWDYATNWNPAQNRLDSEWCGMEPLENPERFCFESFPEQPHAVTWNDLVPRVNAIYDLTGDGRWALKFNYSRYSQPLLLQFVANLNINDVGREDWVWDDANGDGIFQFGEHTSFLDARFPAFGTAIDPDLSAPMTNEFTFGVDHEIADNMIIGITGVIRRTNNRTGDVDIGRPFGPMLSSARCQAECDPSMSTYVDPYVPVESVDPGNDGIIGTADDGGPVTLWARDPAVANDGNILTTNTPTWGFDDYSDYKGVGFVVQKRWSDNWQMLASYDYGYGHFAAAGTTPSATDNNRRQQLFATRPHLFKVTTNYLFAQPVGVNLGLFVRAQSGEPVRAEYTYPGSEIEFPNSPYCCQSSQARYVDARGEGNAEGSSRPERADFVTIVDVRAEKQVDIGRYGVLHIYVDVFNLFNANTVTEFEWVLGSKYGQIDDILAPRSIRLGAAWDF